jgi:hypothetical protein
MCGKDLKQENHSKRHKNSVTENQFLSDMQVDWHDVKNRTHVRSCIIFLI